ncbi:histone deacetylase family protein [Streptomyces sp. A3M-1-3]|uniref:histone deacetylase family protein n=1 Tax=Streptomyces sp. A3M-1-3 TaxID=2962044 RepID=UPI0020B6875B|nr:histone deacetylase family protein [Streptomyces sp. A3M-1-3]MCP3818180.1 histone deacetylase family protein [Streptomyces sp. A3M-1-3]
MTAPLTAVWSDDCMAHHPTAEIWVGVRTPAAEVPERQPVILDALRSAGAEFVAAVPHGDELLAAVHDPGLLEQLREVWEQWEEGGYREVPGQDRVVPYVFPTAAMLGGLPARVPAAAHARAGLWCYDTMTLVGPGTWRAARAAVDAALTAADLVTGGRTRLAYALCRPPGHHAAPAGYGGSCYLNNAAVAAEALRAAGYAKVAVLDIDAHHGNGTQSVFWERPDVFYGSVHVDPGAGWFPHYLGFADETGSGDGAGATANVPLAPGSGDAHWFAAVQRLCERAREFGAEALVVSLGVDAAADDPESPLRVTASGYRETGRLLGALGLPTVAVQEGGYHLPTLGSLVVQTLTGLRG